MNKNQYIDLVKDWVASRDGAYLAKENQIVYYESITGRKRDFKWVYLTPTEVVRIITVTRLSPDTHNLKVEHLLAACQELERVYEYGVRSNLPVKQEVFNFYSEASTNVGEQVMEQLVKELSSEGYSAILIDIIEELYTDICGKLKVEVGVKERRDLLMKHFQDMGYEVKVGAYRPLVEGKKQKAVLMVGRKPKDIVTLLSKTVKYNIVTKIYGMLR